MALVTQPADGLWTSMPRSNTARVGRALLQSMFANFDANPLNGVRSGVVPTTGLGGSNDLLVSSPGGLNVNVSPGSGIAHKAGQGPMLGWLLSTKAVTLTDPPASNPRNDVIFMRMYDLAAGDISPDGTPCRIEVFTGTPAASPVDGITPNALGVYTGIPAQAGLGTGGIGIPLGRAQVSTGGAVTLSDLRRAGSLLGGPVFFLPGDTVGAAATRSGELAWDPFTQTFSISDGSGTRQRIPFGANVPQGWIGSHKPTASVASVGTAETVCCAVTFSGVAGRRVRADWQGDLSSTGTTTASGFRIRWKATASQTDVTGTLISARDTVTSGASNTPCDAFADFVVPSSGTITVVATIYAANGSGNCVQAYNATGHLPALSLAYAGA